MEVLRLISTHWDELNKFGLFIHFYNFYYLCEDSNQILGDITRVGTSEIQIFMNLFLYNIIGTWLYVKHKGIILYIDR